MYVIQSNYGIMMNAGVYVKKQMIGVLVKKVMSGILVHLLVNVIKHEKFVSILILQKRSFCKINNSMRNEILNTAENMSKDLSYRN